MGDKTGIEWTDATWNPTTGCDRVSPGCDHCYAMTLAPRLKAMGSAHYQVDGDPATSGPGFGFQEHADGLDKPLRWTRPRRIFVNSMSDLFHESATRQHVVDVFAVMALAHQHTFQLLTKRPGKMRSWVSAPAFQAQVRDAAYLMTTGEHPSGLVVPKALRLAYGTVGTASAVSRPWPLPNVWVGTSVEDQKRADLRIPQLLGTPAAVRFLSMEPLLGPVTLDLVHYYDAEAINPATGRPICGGCSGLMSPKHEPACGREPGAHWGLDWVIVGGESGAGARPMHPGWVQHLRDQCTTEGVAFHFKQWGNYAPVPEELAQHGDVWVLGRGLALTQTPRQGELSTMPTQAWAPGTRGAEPGRWDRYGDALVRPMHKKDAGRNLDGRTWDEWPTTP